MTPMVYIQTSVALALVIGLIVMSALFLRKKQGKPGMMKVMAYQSLGPKKGIAAVKVGREVLLVGITANDLKLLKSLGEPIGDEQAHEQAINTVMDINEKLRKIRNIKDTMYAGK